MRYDYRDVLESGLFLGDNNILITIDLCIFLSESIVNSTAVGRQFETGKIHN